MRSILFITLSAVFEPIAMISFDLPFASTLSSEAWLALLLTLHTIIGTAGAFLAASKGRDLKLWLFLGVTCGTAALLVALVMKPKQPSERC